MIQIYGSGILHLLDITKMNEHKKCHILKSKNYETMDKVNSNHFGVSAK